MVWCCSSNDGYWCNLYIVRNLDGENHMRYVAVCVMWASVAAVAMFGGHMGPFAAIILAILTVLGMMVLDKD